MSDLSDVAATDVLLAFFPLCELSKVFYLGPYRSCGLLRDL